MTWISVSEVEDGAEASASAESDAPANTAELEAIRMNADAARNAASAVESLGIRIYSAKAEWNANRRRLLGQLQLARLGFQL